MLLRQSVLISQPALDALYERLCILCAEMNQLTKIAFSCAIADITPDEGKRLSAELQAEQSLVRLRAFQSLRESLQPLPKFPDELQRIQVQKPLKSFRTEIKHVKPASWFAAACLARPRSAGWAAHLAAGRRHIPCRSRRALSQLLLSRRSSQA